jgi:hypothetical protein
MGMFLKTIIPAIINATAENNMKYLFLSEKAIMALKILVINSLLGN